MGTAHSHRDEAIVVSSYGHDSWGINVSAEDAAFIEAANPETILELVAMVRAGSAP